MLEITIIGNLGRDAEIKDFNGRKFVAFNVAHSDSYINKEGVKVERTTWVGCLKRIHDDSNIAAYLKKGTQVYLRGDVSINQYTDRNGIIRSDLKCDVTHLELLASPKERKEEQSVECPY